MFLSNVNVSNGTIVCNIGEFEKKYKLGEIKDFLDEHSSELDEEIDIELLFGIIGIDIISSNVNVKENKICYQVSCITDNVQEIKNVFEILFKNDIVIMLKLALWAGDTSGKLLYITGINNRDGDKVTIETKYLEFFKYCIGNNISYVYLYDGKFSEVKNSNELFITEEDIKNGEFKDNAAKDMYNHITSPWSPTAVHYEISLNEFDVWVCEYSVIVYDDIEVFVFGYGNSPQESMENVDKRIQFLRSF